MSKSEIELIRVLLCWETVSPSLCLCTGLLDIRDFCFSPAHFIPAFLATSWIRWKQPTLSMTSLTNRPLCYLPHNPFMAQNDNNNGKPKPWKAKTHACHPSILTMDDTYNPWVYCYLVTEGCYYLSCQSKGRVIRIFILVNRRGNICTGSMLLCWCYNNVPWLMKI